MSTNAERAYQQIRENIISGKYPPKTCLCEVQLANELQISRIPIREALRRLTSEGILHTGPKSEVFVPSWSVERIEHLYDLRATLESSCAGLAAIRMTRADYAELEELATRMENEKNSRAPDRVERLTMLNRKFHERIMECSGNEPLRELTLNAVLQLPLLHRSFHGYKSSQWERCMRHYRELLDAFYVRDADWAAATMRAHVLAGKYRLRLARRDGIEEDEGEEDRKVVGAGGAGHDDGEA